MIGLWGQYSQNGGEPKPRLLPRKWRQETDAKGIWGLKLNMEIESVKGAEGMDIIFDKPQVWGMGGVVFSRID